MRRQELQNRVRKLREETGDELYKSQLNVQKEGVCPLLHESCVKAVRILVPEPVIFYLWIAFTWLCFSFLQ
jgi:hypothetical protein